MSIASFRAFSGERESIVDALAAVEPFEVDAQPRGWRMYLLDTPRAAGLAQGAQR